MFGAKRELAIAIRNNDPVRARQLLEDARRSDPGGAIVPLAQMLIAGEGGPADPKRALSLLKGVSDSWMAKGLLGQLMLEGKWVPRNIQEAVRLIDLASGYDYDTRIQVLRLLADYPRVRVELPRASAVRCRGGGGTGRTRRDASPDRAQTLGKHPVSRSARSL